MIALPKPEVILTHESDLDGLVSGALLQRLARKLHNCSAPIEAYPYNAWRNRDLREKSGWIADFGFEPRMDKSDWVLIDHHAGDIPAKYLTVVHDLTKSAGLLSYELCCEQGLGSPELDRLVHLSNVADMFLEDDPDFILAGDYANLVKVYGFWNLYSLIDGHIEKLLNHPLLEVMAVKRRIEDPLGFEWSRHHVKPIGTGIGYVETVVGNNNLIVFQLLESKATPFPVLMTLFRKNNGTMIASFRSQNGEALKAAEKLQGGGHANAAAAILPKSVRYHSDALEFMRGIFDPAPGKGAPLNSLDSLFASLEKKK
jgi:hypothetical protein